MYVCMCVADRQKLPWSRATCQARQQQQQQQRDTARAKLPGKGRHSGREKEREREREVASRQGKPEQCREGRRAVRQWGVARQTSNRARFVSHIKLIAVNYANCCQKERER